MGSVRVYTEDPLQQDWDEIVKKLVFAINTSQDQEAPEFHLMPLPSKQVGQAEGCRNDPDVKSYNGPVINNLSKLYSRDAEAYSRKCMSTASASSLMSLHTYNPIGFGGDVASNLLAISDAVRIQGARTAGVVRGEEGGTGTGDCA
ncbi:hypothetical protein PInf_002663 [Phytophthora infestans]|nr:hypothetical protein PInf_002663 [Phytophthora infestans]